ncbi:hypothetical protein V6N11_044291 [Hibiscus sabdariffa]|uniref:Deacetylase sirtuin-type domain-containing protein n=1 Tax=Hibiscus sabdariffa TaxID=183260 RepID=A0ABR2RES1_9ROSI
MSQISKTMFSRMRLPLSWISPPFLFVSFISLYTDSDQLPCSCKCVLSGCKLQKSFGRRRMITFCQGSVKSVQTSCRISVPGVPVREPQAPAKVLKDKRMVPQADPPSAEDVNHLHQLIDKRTCHVINSFLAIAELEDIWHQATVLSPNGAYSTGFKPITHQEFVGSSRARRRYWARSYAGWRRFTAAQPGAAHVALASLEQAGRINFMITQNVDNCGFSFCRNLFQDEVKVLNPKIRPDGDIEIDEKFWEDDPHLPQMQWDPVVFFGDNVPKERADKAMEVARECDAFLALGSSLMTMSAFRLISYISHPEFSCNQSSRQVPPLQCADDFVSLKINARLGEILPRVPNTGSLSIPALHQNDYGR